MKRAQKRSASYVSEDEIESVKQLLAQPNLAYGLPMLFKRVLVNLLPSLKVENFI